MANTNNTARNSRFQRGSGVFSCGVCKRSTRATGRGDNEHVGLCVECYEIGGIENQISDYPNDPNIEAWRKEIADLKAACIAKGGKL